MAGIERVAQSYKDRQIFHVSNLTGGAVWEINVLCTIAPAAVLFWSVLQSRYHFFENSNPLALPVDFLLNVGALLVAVTVYANSLPVLLALLIIPATILYVTAPALPPSAGRSRPPVGLSQNSNDAPVLSDFPIRPYLTAYRAGMMVVTVLCILAVDFHVFPRRFAKVETWGTSLMDVGVGSFVFSGGLVSAKSALRTRMVLAERGVVDGKKGKLAVIDGKNGSNTTAVEAKVRQDPQTRAQAGIISRIAAALRASFPLLLLGFIRLYSVKGLDYAEHVSEYGVHWNFFFTLGLLPIGMAVVEPILAALPARTPAHLILGLLIALMHGLALEIDSTGLRAWALTAPRVDLLSQNREGVVSFLGYLSIFLLGREAGSIVLPREPIAGLGVLLSSSAFSSTGRAVSPRTHRRNTLLLLAALSATYAGLAWLLVNPVVKGVPALGSPISRRLANPQYVLWIAAFNHMQIFMYALVETLLFPAAHTARSVDDEKREAARATSTILNAYNAGGLAIFLIANLGTGLVNLTFRTLDANPLKSMGILLAYMVLCTAVALGLVKSGIKYKI